MTLKNDNTNNIECCLKVTDERKTKDRLKFGY